MADKKVEMTKMLLTFVVIITGCLAVENENQLENVIGQHLEIAN